MGGECHEDDWMDLISYLGNANVAGGIMKDTSLQYWNYQI